MTPKEPSLPMNSCLRSYPVLSFRRPLRLECAQLLKRRNTAKRGLCVPIENCSIGQDHLKSENIAVQGAVSEETNATSVRGNISADMTAVIQLRVSIQAAAVSIRKDLVLPSLGTKVEWHRESFFLKILIQRLQHASSLPFKQVQPCSSRWMHVHVYLACEHARNRIKRDDLVHLAQGKDDLW